MTVESEDTLRESVVFAAIFAYTQQTFSTDSAGLRWPLMGATIKLYIERLWKSVLPPSWVGPHPPHWCGAFALACLREAKLTDAHWEPWSGGHVGGFVGPLRLPIVHQPRPGDVAYFAKNQHHAVVEQASDTEVWTIDGNQPAIDRHGPPDARPPRLLSAATAYYSIEPLIRARLGAP